LESFRALLHEIVSRLQGVGSDSGHELHGKVDDALSSAFGYEAPKAAVPELTAGTHTISAEEAALVQAHRDAAAAPPPAVAPPAPATQAITVSDAEAELLAKYRAQQAAATGGPF
jgi:hypothetical protein